MPWLDTIIWKLDKDISWIEKVDQFMVKETWHVKVLDAMEKPFGEIPWELDMSHNVYPCLITWACGAQRRWELYIHTCCFHFSPLKYGNKYLSIASCTIIDQKCV